MFEGFLSESSKYGGDDPAKGSAVGVRAVVGPRAAIWSDSALPCPRVGGLVVEIKGVRDARCYPNSPASIPCGDLLRGVRRELLVAPRECGRGEWVPKVSEIEVLVDRSPELHQRPEEKEQPVILVQGVRVAQARVDGAENLPCFFPSTEFLHKFHRLG